MTNTADDSAHPPLHPCIRPLMEFIKTEMPAITSDQHAERLAEMIIMALPELFTEKPEIFSEALLVAGTPYKAPPRQVDWVAILRKITND